MGQILNKKGVFKHLDFFIIGLLCLIITFCLTSLVRPLGTTNSNIYSILFIYEVLSYIVINYFYSPYSDILKKNRLAIAYSTVVFGLLQLALVTFLLFVIKESATISRLYIAIQYTCYTLFSFIVELIRIKELKQKVKESNKLNGRKLLVVTNKQRLDDCVNDILKYNYDLYNVVGLCIFDDFATKEYKEFKVVCHKDDLLSYVCANWVDSVYLDVKYSDISKDILTGLATMGITTHLRLSKIDSLIGQQQRAETLFNEPVLTSSIKHRSNKQIFRKKCIDLLGGIVGSLITLILAIFIGPIIKIKSPGGPIFYKQERIGLNGRHFYMYKFRSMIPNAEAHLKELEASNRVKDGLMFKMEDDPRIIPGIGTFIRKTSLDEFPQFFNVLKGDMSLVGTRPPTVNEWEKYDLKHRIRMSIKPGITGLWQVSGRNQITDFDEVVRLDKEYIENWHIGLDIKIILKTIKVIFVRKKGESM